MRWNERQLAMLREMGIRVWRAGRSEAPPTWSTPAERRRCRAPPVRASRAAARRAAVPAPARAAPRRRASPRLAPAEWLVVGEPFDAGADRRSGRARAAARQHAARRSASRAAARGRRGRAASRTCRVARASATDRDTAIEAVGRAASSRSAAPRPLALLGVDEPLGRLREPRPRSRRHSGRRHLLACATCCAMRPTRPKAWADLCRAVARDRLSGAGPPRLSASWSAASSSGGWPGARARP